MTTVLKFGKHKGKTINDLLGSDRGYLEWLVKQDFFKEYTIYAQVVAALGGPDAVTQLGEAASASASASTSASASVSNEAPAGTVNFGKYKGQATSVLFADTDYCKWLINQDFFRRNSLYHEVLKLLGESAVKATSVYESGSSGIVVPGDNGTVAFGKMKGQPLGVLLADVGYCRFLLSQSWFAKNGIYAKVKEVVDKAPVVSASSGPARYESPPPETPPGSPDYQSDHDEPVDDDQE